jgi:hypothetical protein
VTPSGQREPATFGFLLTFGAFQLRLHFSKT